MENIIVFGAIGIAVVYLAKKWSGKGGGSCGCGCECPAAKGNVGCCGESETCIADLRQK